MKRILLVVAVLLGLTAEAGAAVDRGGEQFLRGEYQLARETFESAGAQNEDEAALALARLDIREGAWEDAAARSEALVESEDPTVRARARVLSAEIAWRTGQRVAARRELEPIAATGESLRARYLLGRVLLDLGETPQAEAQFEAFRRDWHAGDIDHEDAEALMYVALAARHLASFEEANDTFRDAVALDPELLEANIEWGHLFLEKHAAEHAKESFDEVLQRDPHHPAAHAGMAEVLLESSYDVAAAARHLDEALAVNPRHVPSLLLRATLAIDRNHWEAAHAHLDEVLRVNPRSLRARSLRAAIHWVRDETDAFADIEREVLAKNPSYADFYHAVARSAVREHRYREAIELEKRAVELDPEDYVAKQGIGMGYLRLGDEAEGLSWLRRAWAGDQYNGRTYNTLELFEETIPESYDFVESDNIVYRYHEAEEPILRRYVEPLVERAYDDMSERYDFEPEGPITIELFRDPKDYSIRTTGLPNLGAHAACFGRVITAVSPTRGEVNWAMVLWHEMAHVFALQISNSRVPRWYTEGLAEYETMRAHPAWRREHDADLYAALEEGALPSVADLNHDFLKPNGSDVMIAYHHSALVIAHLARHYGFDEVVRGLELFAEGHETDEVIRAITGQSIAAFDAALHDELRERLERYEGTFQLPFAAAGDVHELGRRARHSPDDPEAHAQLALGQFFSRNARAARAAAARALELDEDQALAHYVEGELRLRRGDLRGAARRYRAILEGGTDGFDVRTRLGSIAARRGHSREAQRQFCKAKRLDPERSLPYRALYELYRDEGWDEEALRELEGYVMREQAEFEPAKALAEGYAELEAWGRARRYGELARDIDPSDGELLMVLGEAYLREDEPDKARHSFESARIAEPDFETSSRAHVGEARALRAMGEDSLAREAAERALEADPDSRSARALLDELR